MNSSNNTKSAQDSWKNWPSSSDLVTVKLYFKKVTWNGQNSHPAEIDPYGPMLVAAHSHICSLTNWGQQQRTTGKYISRATLWSLFGSIATPSHAQLMYQLYFKLFEQILQHVGMHSALVYLAFWCIFTHGPRGAIMCLQMDFFPFSFSFFFTPENVGYKDNLNIYIYIYIKTVL